MSKAAEYFKKWGAMMVRLHVDQWKKSPFSGLPPDLLDADRGKLSTDVHAEIDRVLRESEAEDARIKAGMDPEILEFHGKYNIGFFRQALKECKYEDPEAENILIFGGTCIGPCGCPACWPAHARSRPKPIDGELPHNLDRYSDEAGPPTDMTEEEIDEIYRQTYGETEVEPLLRHARLGKPLTYDQAKAAGWTHVWRRYGVDQKNKIRMIDPSVPANLRSDLERSVPMAKAAEILAAATIEQCPSLREKNVVLMTRRKIKKARAQEKRFEAAFRDHVDISSPMPSDLMKEPFTSGQAGAVFSHTSSTAADDEHAASEEPPLKKRRGAVVELLVLIVMLIIDVHKAYNSIAVQQGHRQYNRFVIWNKFRKAYDFFESLTLCFGNVHSVVAWCRVSAAIRAIVIYFVGIAISVYVDDYPAPLPADRAEYAKSCVLRIFEVIGFAVHPDKVKMGMLVEVLGLLFDVESSPPSFRISEKRRDELLSAIEQILKRGMLTHSDAEQIHGRIMFCLSALVDRQYNPVLRPLTNYIHRPSCSGSEAGLSSKLVTCLQNIKIILQKNIVKRTKFEDPAAPSRVVYSDASYSHKAGWLAAAIVRGKKIVFRRMKVRQDEIHPQKKKHPINFLEICAPTLAAFEFAKDISEHFSRFAIDNDSAKDGLLNMNSPKPEMARAAMMFWGTVSLLGLTPWIDRVPTGYNISDIPTRPDFLLFITTNFPQMVEVGDFCTSVQEKARKLLLLSDPGEFGAGGDEDNLNELIPRGRFEFSDDYFA
eukprot:g19529.t1